MTHVHHQVRLQSNSDSATAELQLQNLKNTVQRRERDCLFEEKNAGSVDRFSWPSFEKVPQQALLRPSKHF